MLKFLMTSFFLSLSLTTATIASTPQSAAWLCDYLYSVKDFPKPGFSFVTYVSLLKDPEAFHKVIETFAERYRPLNLDAIVGLDARGFIFGSALAYELKVPFVMVRKAGKLPKETKRIDYALEYGTASFEIEVDSLKAGDKVVVIDDVLATGGTANAAASLVEQLGAQVVETAFLIEFTFLNGREKVGHPVYSFITFYDRVEKD